MSEDAHVNVQKAHIMDVCGYGRNSAGKCFTQHFATGGKVASAGLEQREIFPNIEIK